MRVLLPLCLGLLLTACCQSSGSYGPIELRQREWVTEPDVSALLIQDATGVRTLLQGMDIAVAEYFYGACGNRDHHSTNMAALFQGGASYPLEPQLTIAGDVVTVTRQLTAQGIELTAVGTFSLAAAQHALAQQYASDDIYKVKLHQPHERHPVPISWNVTGTVSGAAFATAYVSNHVVSKGSEP
jgi:hypothetical protein